MRILFLALFSISLLAGTTGNIKGVVRDEKNEPIGGVTVVATSPALIGEQVVMTDDKGLFVISNLPPGIYTLKAMFAEAASEKRGVEVYIERTVNGDMALPLNEAKGEVYQITEKANHIDVASSTVGVSLTKDYIKNVPLGRDRNFTNAMNALPSSGADAYGQSVGGATSPENVFVVDGMNASDPSTGLSGTRMVMEFVDQFDVKEGGYGPEFGRATGGVVNAATKSGGNDFHGSVFTYYRPGFLQAKPRLIERADDSLFRRNKLDYYLNVGAELGGPIIKDKLWFHAGYSPEFQHDYWYRDIHPVLADSSGNAARDDFGQLRFGPSVYSDRWAGFAQTHQYTFKLTHNIDDDNRHSLAVRGAPTIFNGSVGTPFDTEAPSLSLNGDPSTFQFKQSGGNVVTGIYNYAGKYFGDKLKLDGTLGIHHQESHWSPTVSKKSDPRTAYVYNLGLDTVWDGVIPEECKGVLGATPKCTVRNYSKGGIGTFSDGSLTRFSERLMLTNLFDFVGLHQLKYGLDFEQLRGSKEHGYTGGIFYQRYPTQIKSTEYYVRGIGSVGADNDFKIPSLSQTLNWGAFIGDSWNPIPQLTLNYGFRWEGQDFYGVKNPSMKLSDLSLEKKFSILDNFAPRAGVVWDFLSNGKGVIRFNYGRYFESIPLDLNDRAFGGEGSRIRFAKCNSSDPNSSCGAFGEPTILGGEPAQLASNLKGQYSDEFILSSDYEPFPSWVFGIAGVYRNLGRVIEDMSTDGGNTYKFGNPGFGEFSSVPKATREIWQLQFRLDKKLSNHFLILATYVLSWAKGNYPGLYSATNGQLDPNLSSQFDLPQLIVNRDGYLPQDQRHRIKLSGFYNASFKDFGSSLPLTFNIGLSGVVQSGRPYEVLGADQIYGNDEIFILPRGSGGRTPWTWSIDLSLGLGYDITEDVNAEFFAAFYNLTNNQDPTAYDDTYTYDFVRPIVGGGMDQLDYATNVDGNPITKNPNYGKAVAFQAPFSTQLGFRLRF